MVSHWPLCHGLFYHSEAVLQTVQGRAYHAGDKKQGEERNIVRSGPPIPWAGTLVGDLGFPGTCPQGVWVSDLRLLRDWTRGTMAIVSEESHKET